MNKHLDPVYDVYVDLDKVDKAELYNDYAKLVEKYRDLRTFANELYDTIDGQYGDDWLDDDEKETLREFEAFRINPDNHTTAPLSIYYTIRDENGNALRGEDK
jgi:hypothetical protein